MSLKRTRKPSVMHTIGHQTPAVQHHIATIGGTAGARSSRKTRKRSSSKTGTRTKTRRARKSGGKLAKGSAAAKAWGKKMKRLRKK